MWPDCAERRSIPIKPVAVVCLLAVTHLLPLHVSFCSTVNLLRGCEPDIFHRLAPTVLVSAAVSPQPSSDPSSPRLLPGPLFFNLLVFLCFYAANFAKNIKMPRMSELFQFSSEYQNGAYFATMFLFKIKKNAAKLKKTSNGCKFSNATNFKVLRMCRFILTYFCFRTFILIF